jgi:quercetin dioxygenase-like cupin family protein
LVRDENLALTRSDRVGAIALVTELSGGTTMNRVLLTLAVGVGIGVCGTVAARHDAAHDSVKVLAARDIAEKLDGTAGKATAVEVTLDPGRASAPHRHRGPAFGYVLEGEYEWAINDQPAKILKAGETFYEPTGCLHRVSKNPGTVKTRVVAWVLHPRDAKDIVIPEPKKE